MSGPTQLGLKPGEVSRRQQEAAAPVLPARLRLQCGAAQAASAGCRRSLPVDAAYCCSTLLLQHRRSPLPQTLLIGTHTMGQPEAVAAHFAYDRSPRNRAWLLAFAAMWAVCIAGAAYGWFHRWGLS